MHTSASTEGIRVQFVSEVCTKGRKHAHFGKHRGKNRSISCPKYARKEGNMHTSESTEGIRVHFVSEVCTKGRKHAHFGKYGGNSRPFRVRSMHERKETCTLRQIQREFASNSYPKYARKEGSMHTSASTEGIRVQFVSEVCTNTRKHAHFGGGAVERKQGSKEARKQGAHLQHLQRDFWG